MKRTLLYVGSVFILILSAITFIFIPAMLQKQPKGLVFGKYNGKKIELTQGSEFANALANLESRYKDTFSQIEQLPEGQRDYYRQMYQFQMYGDAFNAAVSSIAYTDAVKKSGYEPSTAAISRAMLQYFSDENGNYSPRLYNATAESTRNEIRTGIRNSLAWSRYYEDVFGTNATVGGNNLFGVKASDAELSFLTALGAEKHSFDLVSWDTAQYPDAEIIAYGTNNSGLFYRHPLAVISVADKAQAEKLLNQLKNSEITFEDAVSEYSEKYYSGEDGLITSNYNYQIKEIIPNEDDLSSVLTLEKDALSDVIQTANNGYAIFRATDEIDRSFVPADNIDVIKTYITTHESGIIEQHFINIAKNFVMNAITNTFDRACRDADVTKVAVPAFPLNYGSVSLYDSIPSDVAALQTAYQNENLLTTAFALKNGEVSDPIVVGTNVLVLKMTGEQREPISEEAKEKTADGLYSLDASSAQDTLLSSDKVENNVYQVFFSNFVNN